MAKREKIIVFFAIVAVIYGAYELSYSPSPKPPVRKNEAVERSSPSDDKIKAEFEKIVPQNDILIVRHASIPWRKDPFSEVPMEPEVVIQQNKIIIEKLKRLSYSGYIAIGDKLFAIIDDMEYEIGDKLPEYEESLIHDISPLQVIVKIKGGEEVPILLIEEPLE